MLVALEKLLVLQDRDRKIAYLQVELGGLEPQRASIRAKAAAAQSASETSRQKGRHIESDRKRLELEVEAKKELIERYSLQQFQTRKNDEYKALAHEIEMARDAIRALEDQQLDLMEQAEKVQKELHQASQAAEETRQASEKQQTDLASRETRLRQEFSRLEAERIQLAEGVDPGILALYERLRRNKGDRVIVGIEHSVCGGCHMKLPAQVLITCQAEQEIPACPNCGRILYYTRDMSLTAAE